MFPLRRRARRRNGYDVLWLPRDGRAVRRFGVSPFAVSMLIALLLGNGLLMAALFIGSERQRIALSERDERIVALTDARDEWERIARRQEVELEELSRAADRLTGRIRELEQLSDEVWSLLGERPDGEATPAVAGGRGGPDEEAADGARRTAVVLGALASQVPLQLQELEQLRSLVEARNHRRDHTPSVWPVDGWVSSEFGIRQHPISGRVQSHNGLDIAAPRGTPVYAPAAGVVRFAGERGGYGLAVIIDHGYGVETLYAHNSALHVRPGQSVERGDVIASVGTTGVSTGPHLHYEVIVNGEPVNPRAFLP